MTDDTKLARCTRKKPYPLENMAKKDADSLTKSEGVPFQVYKCDYGEHWHVGHTRVPEEKTMINQYKFLQPDSGVLLAKIKILDEFWIFMCPPDTQENEFSVLENGILVAHKKGTGYFLEKDGVASKHWQLFSHIMPFYPKEIFRVKEKIEKHKMMEYGEALMFLLNGGKREPLPKRIIIRPEEKKVQEQEMFHGRAVFLTPDGKPFYRDIVTCSCDGCNNEIELRAYISQNDKGELHTINKRIPLDGKAILNPLHSKGSSPKWICKDCVRDLDIDKSQLKKKLVVGQGIISNKNVLADLQRIAADHDIEAEFVRGATQMACHILSSG